MPHITLRERLLITLVLLWTVSPACDVVLVRWVPALWPVLVAHMLLWLLSIVWRVRLHG
jgi:hypothetical protein